MVFTANKNRRVCFVQLDHSLIIQLTHWSSTRGVRSSLASGKGGCFLLLWRLVLSSSTPIMSQPISFISKSREKDIPRPPYQSTPDTRYACSILILLKNAVDRWESRVVLKFSLRAQRPSGTPTFKKKKENAKSPTRGKNSECHAGIRDASAEALGGGGSCRVIGSQHCPNFPRQGKDGENHSHPISSDRPSTSGIQFPLLQSRPGKCHT